MTSDDDDDDAIMHTIESESDTSINRHNDQEQNIISPLIKKNGKSSCKSAG